MRRSIQEKLKRLEDVFPPERLAKSKERWRRLWRGEPLLDRQPFVLIPVDFSYYDDIYTKEEGLDAYLDCFIRRGIVQDDYIPAFFTGCRMGAMPSLFGAKELDAGSGSWSERMLTTAEDVFRLPEPAITPDSAAGQWLDAQRYYMEQTEGRIPVHVADMQGPLDVCGQLWGYENVLAAPYEEEDAYRTLLDKTERAFLLLWKAQAALLGDCFLPTHLYAWDYVPPDNGGTLSADSLVMLSPAFFKAFYKPCLEDISRQLGGLTVHSCGNFSQVVPNLCGVSGLRGINASQMDAQMLTEAGADKDKVFIFQCPYDGAEALGRYVSSRGLRVSPTITGAWTDDWYDTGRAELMRRVKRVEAWLTPD